MIELGKSGDSRLVRRLRPKWLKTILSCRWGDPRGWEYLQDSPHALAVIDCQDVMADLNVIAASLTLLSRASIFVSRSPVESSGLLNAGALNVLADGEPDDVLVARIKAEMRWLARQPASGSTTATALAWDNRVHALTRHQTLLMRCLLRLRGPTCCHHFRRLLSAFDTPLSLPAFRGRLDRLEPHLNSREFSCRRVPRYGTDIISLESRA
ncbi:hypothetical protein [Actinacidiphila rubida]|uniref:hypothetical protein n=1 Tax=Actinacidiphila rubida TaxID=310780 RepID=UPI00114CE143|nr:hypothetical protein [Actinacidiphila rubida]